MLGRTFILNGYLKTGIGLRGYNQKDPLVEYKKSLKYVC